jgi:hypothetical protein
MATTAERLAEVDAAISATLLAQSYAAPGGRSKTMASLKDLTDLRDRLATQLAREQAGGIFAPIRMGGT